VRDDQSVAVAGDDLREPFATVVFLRREYVPVAASINEEGDAPDGDIAFRSRVLAYSNRSETPLAPRVRVTALWRRIGCLSSRHSSQMSRLIVRTLMVGVVGDVDGPGRDHGSRR